MSAPHHRRHATISAAIVTIMACSVSPAAAAQQNDTAVPRLRSSDASITHLIEQAITRSPTFKRLVSAVNASNGMIYVESGVCTGRVPACLPMWMSSSGGNRFMRIVLDRQRLDSDGQLVAAIGHELQHAIEVLSDRSVTDSRKMYFFYRGYAPTDRGRFETKEAIDVGLDIASELRAWRTEANPCSSIIRLRCHSNSGSR